MITLTQTAILLAAAVIAVSLFRFARLSSILGYLAAGLVIGPWGLNLIGDVHRIIQVAQFGIVLLLFIIGLELQPTRLWVMRRIVFGLGAAQVLLCTLLLGAIAWALGQAPAAAAVIGFGLSLSSTPLVLQLLAERRELKTQHGRAAFGVLLFQDLAVLPALAILPLLEPSATTPASGGSWWVSLLKLVGVGAAVLIGGGRVLLRPALRLVARVQVSEVFTAAALLTVILTALLANRVGLSMPLGAFLAGVLLADSEFRHELEADLEPFKGLLLGLFFISVGMTANLGLLRSEPLKLLAVTAGFLIVKVVAVSALGKLARLRGDSPLRLGFALPTGGEFAFVLFTLASRGQLLDAATTDLLILAVTLSMMLGPLLLIAYEAVSARWADAPAAPYDSIDAPDIPVIIAGFGRFGQIVARVLRVKGLPFTALDSSQTHVDFVRRFGNQVYYGDASRLDLLRAAGAQTARVLVLAIDDLDAAVRTATVVREQFPQLRIFARARSRQHVFALMDAGVTEVIRETYASSLEMAAAVLEALGETPANAREAVRRFRQHDQKTLLAQYQVKEDEKKFLATSLAAAQQLERLFEADKASSEPTPPHG
ncbi:MAG TPA: monovalent cation:proton antiporter-2 (CPA2) family protein [Steroidobacteraceae bacterium]|jgi:glutathione-regulated potassium-efflux system ancillary protein KefC/glutathione-regulated potassium-efflux system protein KefB|nr:monovalent cation:proton antiporter-2 (CPA2) family protein [Steroidobacteraceae bacterium]